MGKNETNCGKKYIPKQDLAESPSGITPERLVQA